MTFSINVTQAAADDGLPGSVAPERPPRLPVAHDEAAKREEPPAEVQERPSSKERQSSKVQERVSSKERQSSKEKQQGSSKLELPQEENEGKSLRMSSKLSGVQAVGSSVATAAKAVTNMRPKVNPLRATVMVFGSFLACCAGMTNAISFYALGSFTSHVTGTWTKVALTLERHEFEDMWHYLLLVVAFVMGACICGCLIPKSTVASGYSMYGWTLIGNALLLGLAVALEGASDAAPYFVAAACGLQNGMITSYSGAVIRTTHVTGIATDIGLLFGRFITIFIVRSWRRWKVWRGGPNKDPAINQRFFDDSKKLALLLLLAWAFFIGVVAGAALYDAFHVYGLLVPAACSGLSGASYTVYRTFFLGKPLFDFSGFSAPPPSAAVAWVATRISESPLSPKALRRTKTWSADDSPHVFPGMGGERRCSVDSDFSFAALRAPPALRLPARLAGRGRQAAPPASASEEADTSPTENALRAVCLKAAPAGDHGESPDLEGGQGGQRGEGGQAPALAPGGWAAAPPAKRLVRSQLEALEASLAKLGQHQPLASSAPQGEALTAIRQLRQSLNELLEAAGSD